MNHLACHTVYHTQVDTITRWDDRSGDDLLRGKRGAQCKNVIPGTIVSLVALEIVRQDPFHAAVGRLRHGSMYVVCTLLPPPSRSLDKISLQKCPGGVGGGLSCVLQMQQIVYSRCRHTRGNPFRTAVPFWGLTTQIMSSLSPERDCGVLEPGGLFL